MPAMKMATLSAQKTVATLSELNLRPVGAEGDDHASNEVGDTVGADDVGNFSRN